MSCRMPSVQLQTFLHPTYHHQHNQQTFVKHWRILEKNNITYFFMISQLNLPTHSSFFPFTDITKRVKINAKNNVFIFYNSLSNLWWQLTLLCNLAFRFGFIHISCSGTDGKIWLARGMECHVTQLKRKKKGPTEIWTRILGFRVPGANRYTIGPRTLRECYVVGMIFNYDWVISYNRTFHCMVLKV